MSPDIQGYLASCQQRFTAMAGQLIGEQNSEFSQLAAPLLETLYRAANYSVSNGGKRIRPALVYASAAALGADDVQALDNLAAAVELAHCYSLVHDDLPAMDDDDLRRGMPSCHRAFDEATAILVGDGLQARAFELVAESPFSAPQRIEMIKALAAALGMRGMVGGQSIDINATDTLSNLAQLQCMHQLKTGALIQCAVKLGALAADANPQQLDLLARYAQNLGLAFQVVDDVLDVTSDTASLGKTGGKDKAANKATYTQLLGVEDAKRCALDLRDQAVAAAKQLPGGADMLVALADFVVARQN